MDKIIFTCKTITPLVMNGAYDKIPELRPPGIKASIRFWWRAFNGHLPLDQLRAKEGELFGNTKGRSKIMIRVLEMKVKNINIKTPLLPHKNNDKEKSPVPAFVKDLEFKIRIDYDLTKILKNEMKNLFITTCILGGWGKRSRRGFGSVQITEIDGASFSTPTNLTDILSCLDGIVPKKYKNTGTSIESTTISGTSTDEYPKLWKIEIGNSAKTLSDIGQATHDVKGSNWNKYSFSIGDGRTRLASPVYISILPNGLPIISTLKTQDRNGRKVDATLQETLKDKILK